MSLRKPVLITGHRGYLGAVMAPYLMRRGYDVVGLDTGYFDECCLGPEPVRIPTISKDIRDLTVTDVKAFYAVVHLAALSNDPIGNLDADWTREINHEASVRLAELSREAKVRRFLFSSSCIMYGMSEAKEVAEDSPLDPKTEYARSKMQSEQSIREMAADHFSPVFIRNGTVYGLSPRMRFDTVLNDFVGAALTRHEIIVQSDGRPWRPVVHVEDVARTFELFLKAPGHLIHNQIFNNGASQLNHQVRELAEIAVEAVPGCSLEIRSEAAADQRTYKADFSKFRSTFPDFEFRWDARSGARKLAADLQAAGLTREMYEGKRFVRLRWLRHLLDSGRLDRSLRWVMSEEVME